MRCDVGWDAGTTGRVLTDFGVGRLAEVAAHREPATSVAGADGVSDSAESGHGSGRCG